ncbi:hypothetical protein [Teredinibacter haidensis]|uniref:hypothetical protein n=1 Tax=Teredinibacter haidensis TaxID=2731755 RepID=UPI0009490AB3|nr:hypothetical protein [Teredinibacter haidensis]
MKAVLHILLISLLSFQAFAFSEKIPEEQIRQYMALSGVDEIIDSVPLQIEAMINQRLLTSENPETEKEIMQVLTYSWDSSVIKESIFNHIQKNSNSGEISALLDWRKSPLVVKITAAELDSASPNFQGDLLHYIADLQVAPPAPETIQAIRRLVVATDMVDMMVEMAVQVTKAMTTAFLQASGGNDEKATIELDKQIDSMRALLTPQMEQQAVLMSYYIYRNISNEELDSYSSFYNSNIGKRELTLVSESLSVAMSLWAEQSAIAIVKNLESKNDKTL